MTDEEVDKLAEILSEEIYPAAEDAYAETMCVPVGCCGDLHGAVQVAVLHTIQRVCCD